ncbi:isotrichodermin C-15 hydroxylase [Diaporthe helianthi]|uniref:Isotrichodermin C-15 hydroxylase n=1 Tax=Diaporthe helianthi TaxID=158607 RepID=A0A2P5HF35_DIAHE|nr:isotrichodermin C-15 hydroxylase [Diaporthe helianthi]
MERPFWVGKEVTFSNINASTILLAALGLGLAYSIGTAIYNLYLHPLRHLPGPKLNAISQIPYTLSKLSGQHHRKTRELSLKYGYVVRVAPGTLSILHPDTVKIIHGHRKAGRGENARDPIQMKQSKKNIFGVDREEHSRLRRILAPGFSNQAMMEQEPMFREYADKLVNRLQSATGNGQQPQEMTSWFNWVTFDVIGDLSFGEPFGCLDSQSYHPWVSNIFSGVKENLFANEMLRYGSWIGPMLAILVLPRGLAGKHAYHYSLSREKVAKRMASGVERPDYVSKMLGGRKGKGDGLSFDEIVENASPLIIAGSETSATTMSAVTYFLTTHPEALARAVAEVRESFSSNEAISLTQSVQTPFLDAVFNETHRLFPAAPVPTPRVVNKDGEIIDGRYIPGGILVENILWSIQRHPNIFHRPDEFHPERWLGDERFKNDRLDAVTPFGDGPRVCIGKNLANAEMRMLMCKVLWNFDLVLAEDSKDWQDQCKAFIIWEKPDLNVYLKPRQH